MWKSRCVSSAKHDGILKANGCGPRDVHEVLAVVEAQLELLEGPNRFPYTNMGSAPHFTILNFNPQTMVHPIKDSSIDFCKDTPESVRRDTTSGSCMHVFIKSAQSKAGLFLEYEISTHSNPAGI